MADSQSDLLSTIHELVDEEHRLRESVAAGDLTTEEEQARLQRVEQQLDQCWDLLRQRRARIAAGRDPNEADARDIDEVEGYLQ